MVAGLVRPGRRRNGRRTAGEPTPPARHPHGCRADRAARPCGPDDAEFSHGRKHAGRDSQRFGDGHRRDRDVLCHDFRQSLCALGRGAVDFLGLHIRLLMRADFGLPLSLLLPSFSRGGRRGARRDHRARRRSDHHDARLWRIFRGLASVVSQNQNILLGTDAAEWLGTGRPLGVRRRVGRSSF